MISASQAYIDAMTAHSVTPYVRIDLLDKNENLIERIDTSAEDGTTNSTSGSISVDRDRDARRQVKLVLDNTDGSFSWNAGGTIWIDKRMKLYIGLQTQATSTNELTNTTQTTTDWSSGTLNNCEVI